MATFLYDYVRSSKYTKLEFAAIDYLFLLPVSKSDRKGVTVMTTAGGDYNFLEGSKQFQNLSVKIKHEKATWC